MKFLILTVLLSFTSAAWCEVTVNTDAGTYGPTPLNLAVQYDDFNDAFALGYEVMGEFFSFQKLIGCERLQVIEGKVVVCDGRVIGSVGKYSTDGNSAPKGRFSLADRVDAHIWGTPFSKEFPMTFAVTRIRSSDCGDKLNARDLK